MLYNRNDKDVVDTVYTLNALDEATVFRPLRTLTLNRSQTPIVSSSSRNDPGRLI